MEENSENILDQPSFSTSKISIDFDLKMVRGFALSYFIYGLIYWIQINEFLVPLPMVYFFIPLAGIVMFIRSVNWIGSALFLFIPFIVIKDLFWSFYPTTTGIISVLTFTLWTTWSWFVFVKNNNRETKDYFVLASQHMIWLIWLIRVEWVQITLILTILVGITMLVRKGIEDPSQVYNVRVGLLIQLIISLYLMQKLSIFWVALG